MATKFERLVRFKDEHGRVHLGEAPTGDLVGATVPVYSGHEPWNIKVTDEHAKVKEVLSPLSHVPIMYGIGMNYKLHLEETGFPTPKYPVLFTKPPDAIAGPYDDIPINPVCTNMDYEAELSIVIGKDFKNFKPHDNPWDYIVGLTASNDVSSRFWQMPEQSGNQHGYAKSFDHFAPLGPVLVSPSSPFMKDRIRSGTVTLQLSTHVNGEQRQNGSTEDLLFDITELLVHLSRGTTIRKGTVIMTGTPSGVAAFMKPPKWLQNGDVVEVAIEGIGKIRNKMVIEDQD